MRLHVRRISLMLVNVIINNVLALFIIGVINKRFQFINTIFVAYPATEEYALSYVYPWYRHKMKWTPWPAGVFYQNGKWGLMTVVSAIEKDFKDGNNIDNLKLLIENTLKIKDAIHAKQITFAGILPGVLYKNNLSDSTLEAMVTVQAVILAEKKLIKKLNYSPKTPLIILGAKGFIGSRIIKDLGDRDIYKIDVDNKEEFPIHLKGKETVLINLTKKDALLEYVQFFWKELVLLNETYPEPSQKEVKLLSNKGCKAFHLVGVKASSFPSFPKAYYGGIPCCAAWLSPDMEINLKHLVVH